MRLWWDDVPYHGDEQQPFRLGFAPGDERIVYPDMAPATGGTLP